MSTGKAAAYLLLILSASGIISCTEEPVTPPSDGGASRSEPSPYRDCAVLSAEAQRMDSILLGQLEPDKVTANAAIRTFTEFAHQCRHDTMSAIYLIKTAQVARAVSNIPQARLALEQCIADHPQFAGRPAAIFMLAQLYDEPTYMNDESEAKRLYERIIEEYPGSDWALSARGALKFIGKSDEQIIREFTRKK
jgi:hypothetical protein